MRRDILLASVAGAVVGSWLTLVVIQLGEHGFTLPGHNSGSVADSRPAPTETAKADIPPQKNIEAPKPAETDKRSDAAAGKTPADDQAKAQPAKPATETTPDKATPSTGTPASTTTSGGDTPPPEAAPATVATPVPAPDDTAKSAGSEGAKTDDSKAPAPQPATPEENKTAADPTQSNDASAKPTETPATPDAVKNTGTASAETPKPIETPRDKADATAASPPPASADQAKTDPATDNRIPADQLDREMATAAHQIQPPEPPSEQASLGPAQKPQEQTPSIELIRPFSDQAGIVTIAGKSVKLLGIVPTDVDRMCTGPSGKSWPCGQAARTAFRMYLRGRTIDCDLPSAAWQGTVTGSCRYVRIDLSAWLVRFGWAEPEPGSPLLALVEEAKEKKRGIYGDDPRKGGKSTLAAPLPKEDPLNPI